MSLLTKMVCASVVMGGAGIASAQPTEPGPGTTDVTPVPQPQPPPRPEPPPQAEPLPAQPMAWRDPAGMRPNDLAIGIGIGYARLPGGSMDLQTPNIASVRLRLVSGITFEPIVTIGNTSTDTSVGMTDSTETITELDLGTLVRFPIIRHGNVDFEILGSAALDVVKDDPDGDFNTKTTTGFALGWGIGIGYWLSPHFQLTASATNPLLEYTSTKQDTGPNTQSKTSTTTFEVAFNPTTIVMLHLYN